MTKKEQIEKCAEKYEWDDLKKKRMSKLFPQFTMTMSFSEEDEHALSYVDEKLGVTMEIITPKKNGQFQDEQRYYFINGDKQEFRKPVDMMEALYQKKYGKVCQTCGGQGWWEDTEFNRHNCDCGKD